MLHDIDSVSLRPPFVAIETDCKRVEVCRRKLYATFVDGFPCASGVSMMVELARQLDDLRWEQALESALRKQLLSVDELSDITNKRVRRVMRLRPSNAPPTGSLLETLAVQLIRTYEQLPTPSRQVEVLRAHGRHPAYVDLAWPDLGVFLELDGEQHKGQLLYDSTRQTAVIAATGWLVGRYTWSDVVHRPTTTLRSIAQLVATRTGQQ